MELGDPVVDALGGALADAEGVADVDGVDAPDDPGVAAVPDPVVVPLVGRDVGGFVVGFGVVGLGVVGFVVGFGCEVAVGAGGAVRGCCPDPKRNPMTLPDAGV